MTELNDIQFVALVAEVVEVQGCSLADIDFEDKVIHLEGSEEAMHNCAQALRDIFGWVEKEVAMTIPVRISAEEVREKTRSGAALLVCAYEEDDKFTSMQLEGAIGWRQFQSLLPDLSRDREIIFYCAWTAEATAAGRAETYLEKGYQNVTVLGGGVAAWKEAGYPIVVNYQI